MSVVSTFYDSVSSLNYTERLQNAGFLFAARIEENK
jgi:hypothetical protein